MSREDFSPEVLWSLILPLLYREKPENLSRPYLMRNGDLVSAMRTCKLFLSICEPLLYKHAYTDNFRLFMRDCDRPSKVRQFQMIRSLNIDYKYQRGEPTYESILEDGGDRWLECGRSAKEIHKVLMKHCKQEYAELRESLLWTPRGHTMISTVFSLLETVAVGAIRGIQEDWYKTYYATRRDAKDFNKIWADQDCSGNFDGFLQYLPKLRQLYIRDATAPFSFPDSTHASHVPFVRYARTQHFASDVSEVSLPIGSPITWTSDARLDTAWTTISQNLYKNIERCIDIRNDRSDGRDRAVTDTIQLKIYCSTGRDAPQTISVADMDLYAGPGHGQTEPLIVPGKILDLAEQKKLVKDAGEMVQEICREHSKLKDVIDWRISPETPICAACGSGPPC